jgi:hypothetical protein
MRSRVATLAFTCVVVLGLSARAGATSIVLNGGFETGNFANWTLSGNVGGNTGVCLSGTNFLGSVCTANSGSYAAVSGPFGAAGFISQALATAAGNFYDITFFLRNDNLGAPPSNLFQVHWDGGVVYSISNAATQGFTQVTLPHLLASTSNTTLSFEIINNPGGFLLDDVSVSAIPEPATLLLVGTGIVAGLRRSKSR